MWPLKPDTGLTLLNYTTDDARLKQNAGTIASLLKEGFIFGLRTKIIQEFFGLR